MIKLLNELSYKKAHFLGGMPCERFFGKAV